MTLPIVAFILLPERVTTTLPIIVGDPVLKFTLLPATTALILIPPELPKGAAANDDPPKYIYYLAVGKLVLSQVIETPGTIPSHFLIKTDEVSRFALLPVGNTVASAVIVTVPEDRFVLLPVTDTVAFAATSALPIVKFILLPVTDTVALADIVTSPVFKLVLDPSGSTTAFPTMVGDPVLRFTLLPVTEYLEAKVGVPVFRFTLLPVIAVIALPTIVGSPVEILICDPSGVTMTPAPSIIVVLPIEKFNPLPVTAKLALPTNVTDPVDSLILEPLTLTKALGLKPGSAKGDAEKGVPPKYIYYNP